MLPGMRPNLEILRSFGPLGWTSFGGPAAHLGYFREEFVHRRGWVGENAYAALVSMSQFLPGPASSKVGMALGYHRGGLAGMGLSWLLFTLPSALLMALAGLAYHLGDAPASSPAFSPQPSPWSPTQSSAWPESCCAPVSGGRSQR